MKLVEIRDLDGPNLFLLEPAIKVEFQLDTDADLVIAAELLAAEPAHTASSDLELFIGAVNKVINDAHLRHGQATVRVTGRALETPLHYAIAFGWSHRAFALALADRLVGRMTGGGPISTTNDARLAEALRSTDPGDRPLMISDEERCIPVVGVTGTNGKTTTTRLLAHILMATGRHVGWSSTSGVYIDGEEVLVGDYAGPAGARRVLSDPCAEVAVLETARGGILLRGLACESNNVSVFTNISPDHLNLHGVRTVDGLAEVKAVVVRTTRPDGTAVLNADDPLVIGSTLQIEASKLFFTCEPNNATVNKHLAAGGRSILLIGDDIVFYDGAASTHLANVREIPITFGGRALHMIQNAMAAAGAAIGLGLPTEAVARGLYSFRNSTDQNLGRLNVFDQDGLRIVVDYAHNESGLSALLDFARKLISQSGRITVMIGTAGDRTDESLREIGRLAAAGADRVIVKRTRRYERGRTNEEMIALFREGAELAGNRDVDVSEDELAGYHMAIAGAGPGDVIALMCQEQITEIVDELNRTSNSLN